MPYFLEFQLVDRLNAIWEYIYSLMLLESGGGWKPQKAAHVSYFLNFIGVFPFITITAISIFS